MGGDRFPLRTRFMMFVGFAIMILFMMSSTALWRRRTFRDTITGSFRHRQERGTGSCYLCCPLSSMFPSSRASEIPSNLSRIFLRPPPNFLRALYEARSRHVSSGLVMNPAIKEFIRCIEFRTKLSSSRSCTPSGINQTFQSAWRSSHIPQEKKVRKNFFC